PKIASTHFERLWSKVSYPVSRARAAYWAGRAAEAEGRTEKAKEWHGKATQYFTTFYGQLAMGRLGAGTPSPLPGVPGADGKTITAFLARDVVRGAKLIAKSQERSHFRAFIKHLSRRASSPVEYALTAEIAMQSARPDVALRAAKQALLNNVYLIDAGWPLGPLPQNQNGVEPGLILALMRQESAFDPGAVSRSGARGLMQLMPATAKAVARGLNLPFSRKRLLNDWDYNLTIGTTYLSEVLSSFGGTYVLALAGYNAGPTRVKRWLNRFGDFRTDKIDAVDWIEMIPVNETRNYVQRVIENLQVYRAILGNRRIADTALQNAAF
ncbi:MAG: lytic transglycosylase domain-containing protein, partial [Alphaproteobacteria bacterium]|nr:lytic transglycosylase domain-containing protein [Alphaproteobacteria bacterium]